MNSTNQDECVLCCREITVYAMGFCDHPVCYECSARMRVLCETNECPICRSDMPLVVFALQIEPYADISKKFSLFNKQYKILFENERVRTSFEVLLLNNCQICNEEFPTFQKLKDHMRRKHEQYYCELCTDNLKIFTFERKSYNRKDLARHKIKGDPDQKSHRGHPLCEFCDMRYVDNDDLFRHLRREHFFCHFCDADGSYQQSVGNEFCLQINQPSASRAVRQVSREYVGRHIKNGDYEYLKTHFRNSHFLCEEGNCANEQFTSAFRTEIDLKAHKATQHGKNMSKAEARQTRTLEFEFNYVPHARPTSNSSPRGRRFAQQRRNNLEEQNSNDRTNLKKEPEAEPLDTQSTQEFPYLSDDAVNGQTIDGKPPVNTMLNSLSLQSFGRNAPPAYRRSNLMRAEDFPALGSATSANSFDSATSQNYNSDMHNNNNNNNSSRLTSLSAQISKKNSNHGNAKINKVSNEKKAQPKWIAKRDSSNFEENFPELDVKRAPLTTSASVAVRPSMQNYISSVSTQQNTTSEEPSNTEDQFVIIKSKPKKKKQSKIPQTSEEDTLSTLLTSINRESNLKNQENEDPFKRRLLHPSETPKPIYKESDTWEKEVHFGKDDFPPLEVMGKPSQPPPGLNIKKSRVPPPGFNTNSNISSNSSLTLSSIARMVENDFQNICNTQEENGVLDSSKSFDSYQKPPNFSSRNEILIQRINEVSGNQKNFLEFKNKSREFRCNNISAAEYYDKCLEILGEHGFQEIFPELVSLLPDVPKQQELLAVHKRYLGQQNSAIKQKSNSKNKYKISLTSCSSCNQVLSTGDHESHSCVS